MAAMNALGSSAFSLPAEDASATSATFPAGVTGAAEGTVFDDHFQPGQAAGSSRRESREDASGALESFAEGSRKRVIENPGMFKLVLEEFSTRVALPAIGWASTHHKGTSEQPLNLDVALGQSLLHLITDGAQLKFARSAEVVDHNYDSVAVSCEWNKGAVGIRRGDEVFDELRNQLVQRRDGFDAAVTRLVMNAHANLNLVLSEVRLPGSGSWNVTMLKSNTDCGKSTRHIFGRLIHRIEASATVG